MTDELIIKLAIDEIENRTLGVTEQFLEIHQLVYTDNKPSIARVDTERDDEAIVYFKVEGEKFFLVVYFDIKPTISLRSVNIEAYHSVYFRAFSDTLSLQQLSELTKLSSTYGRNKGDIRGGNGVWKESTIDFEPNPEADEFEDKLDKLLDYLEQDEEGVKNLIKNAGGYIQVYSSFHNGNTMIGGHRIKKQQIKRMGRLNLAIDFDSSADGNFFN
ncbi:DUF4279 domain-containing protein [Pedobacter sp. UC225_61]|uniref:DUF4279 domain-containing protein n=1 Tax=Pedobacter sp. UC225_61 TaxID=3374623 RepID=UPI00379F3AA9